MEVGSRFDSFSEFERAFREFQVRNNALFVTKASKKIEVVNARLSSGLKRLDPKLKFANATYVCKHGGELRCTGTGIRPRQRTMKQNCPATVVIAARREAQQLEVIKVDCNHCHELSNELFQSYPENRRLTDEEKNYALPLMELNVLPSVIAGKLNEKTGKTVLPKDLHNVRASVQGTDEAKQLVEEIENCRSKHNAKVVLVTDENKELQLMFIQTPLMQHAFQSFPEVLLLDATYKTNKLKMPLFVFLVQDGCGNSQVVAYAFVASEQYHNVSAVLDIFVRENSSTEQTKVVVVDKDFTAISAIRSAFSSKPAIQLCQFHVVKAFQTAANQLAKSADERKSIIRSFKEMLHAPTTAQFEEARMEFERYANKEALEYYKKNWDNIREMWVRHLCDQEFTSGNNTTNRVEAHNGVIKTVLSSSTKLSEALSKLVNLAAATQQKTFHTATLLKTCQFYSYKISEVEKQCAQVLTPYACALVSKELSKMRDTNPEVKEVSPAKYHVASASGDTSHEVCLKNQTCSCTTFSKMALFCRHFLAVCTKLSVQPDIEKAVHKRWFKSYQTNFVHCAQTSNQDSHASESLEVLSIPGPCFKKMNRNQRFNFAMQTLKAVADTLADCHPEVFASRLKVLEDVNKAWLQGNDVTVGSPEASACSGSSSKNSRRMTHSGASSDSTDKLPRTSSLHEERAHEKDACGEQQEEMLKNRHDMLEEEDGCTKRIREEDSCGEQLEEMPENQEDAQQDDKDGCLFKLPVVKSRGRPAKRLCQRKLKRDRKEHQPVPFKELSPRSQEQLLLTGIAGQDATRRVLEKGCRLDESEVEVRPELLPSALLDCNVCLPKIKKFFTPDAWLSLMSSIATKKQEELWLCGQCKRKDDGEIKMISCDRCLEWFHWPCVQVKKQDIGRLWFCPGCSLSV
nr:uncharacterized protein LOC126519678 [Dermacentor andersoni]